MGELFVNSQKELADFDNKSMGYHKETVYGLTDFQGFESSSDEEDVILRKDDVFQKSGRFFTSFHKNLSNHVRSPGNLHLYRINGIEEVRRNC